MKILISNDDGINSSGILAAKEAVEDLGHVTVVAPSSQQSGIGRALTLFEPLRIAGVQLKDGSRGFSVSGTPTDAVTLGIFELMEEQPTLAIAGINTGENIGKGELTTSGTIGAAMEAASYGIPTIAVSLQVSRGDIKFEDGHVDIDYSFAKEILKKVSKKVVDKGLPDGIDLLNLNIPSHPNSDEIAITTLGERMYNPHIEMRFDPRGKPYYWIDGTPFKGDNEGSDGHALKTLKVPTLTPLSMDFTSNLDSLNKWLD
ncbi:5'/3'-nucleotidase SurE [Methanobrevibacter sp. TMH8]|uniref:5'/3'-nucleotidase SurE n=1 Tax=Methanobrevibacter sp. TMH8 TaxID=2848611 RepID=UPI001CC8F241|nr:5'/3'-nucleotidase SurE [Methanobrevibacter sp. TMH8]MBZ9570501.1 5'/3'-nucleotidase SurE [Methanobrevibacter sp. TMH8]